jgi:hypothetical protein
VAQDQWPQVEPVASVVPEMAPAHPVALVALEAQHS